MVRKGNVPDGNPEVPQDALFRVIAEVPEDRRTPLDAFLAESLLEHKVVTREQLRESLEAWRSAQEPMTLCQTMISTGAIRDSDVDTLLRLYKKRLDSEGVSGETSEIAFGEIAIRKNLTTHAEIWSAIEEQERRRAAGSQPRLGEILVDRGTVTVEQARDILESQGKRILHCPNCGDQFNVTNYSPGKDYTCLSCGGSLSDTGEILGLTVRGTAAEGSARPRQADADSFIGREIGGCRVVSKIGEGGMGAVYRAEHMRLNRPVAVKLMAPGLMGEVHRKRFVREARAAAQLDHSNIMTVYDVDEFEGVLYIVMQYIDGMSVGEILDAKGKFDQLSALKIILQASEALEAANEHRIVHRDIKPDNLMITKAGQVKVMDFGLAKHTGPEDVGVTASGAILGTPLYMSPEQFRAETLDGRSDIYSLGATFFHMVTGRPPFAGGTVFELRDRHLKTSPPSPRKFSPELSPRVCKVIERMLAKNKFKRYKSAAELVADLKRALAELGGESQEASAGKKRTLMLAVPAAVVVIAVVAVLLLLARKPSTPAESALEKRATGAWETLKPKVAENMDRRDYCTALGLLNNFSAELADTVAGREVGSIKVEVMQLAIAYFEEMLKSINQEIASSEIALALQHSRGLAEQAREIKSCISAVPRTGRFVKLITWIEERAAAAESISAEIEDFDETVKQCDSLKKEDKKDKARELITGKNFQNPELRRLSRDLVDELTPRESASPAEWDRWEKAKQTALSLLNSERFDDAVAFISIGGFESSPVAEIAAEVKALLTEISKKRSEYIKEELDEAARLASDWQLSDAGMIVENHRAEPGFKDTIDSLLATISERLRYLGDESEAKNLVSSGKHEQARLKLQRWLASPDTGIAQRARELYLKAAGEENPKMAFFLAGRYGLPNARLVNLDAFFIDKYEVTNAQYKNFLRDTERSAPLGWKGDSEPDLPVTGVSYYDAVAYAKSVGKRLLTQEEWEIAASWDSKAKKARIFPWGNVFDHSKCNIGSQRAEPVGASSGDVSDCGAFDMAGNVCEWTETRVGTRRVVCGGSFADSGDKSARCDTSVPVSPSKRSTRMGFRCAKSAR